MKKMKKSIEYNGGGIETCVYQPDKNGMYKIHVFAYVLFRRDQDDKGVVKEDTVIEYANSEGLLIAIKEYEDKAKRFIDTIRDPKPFTEDRLIELGFK